MKTCVRLDENSDGNRWGDLTTSIRAKVPGAYIRLHNEFGRGLELILRRQIPKTQLGAVLDQILGNVTLAIECGGLSTPDLLPALVRCTARELIPTSVARIETEVSGRPNEVLERILQQLPNNQREALEMVYVDGTDDHTVCARTRLTINELTAIRDSVRERFTLASGGRRSNAMHSSENFLRNVPSTASVSKKY
jgi:hypothetical protein